MKPGEIWKKRNIESDGFGNYNQIRWLKILARPKEYIEHPLDDNLLVVNEDEDWQVEEWWENFEGQELHMPPRRVAFYSGETIFRYFEKVYDESR